MQPTDITRGYDFSPMGLNHSPAEYEYYRDMEYWERRWNLSRDGQDSVSSGYADLPDLISVISTDKTEPLTDHESEDNSSTETKLTAHTNQLNALTLESDEDIFFQRMLQSQLDTLDPDDYENQSLEFVLNMVNDTFFCSG